MKSVFLWSLLKLKQTMIIFVFFYFVSSSGTSSLPSDIIASIASQLPFLHASSMLVGEYFLLYLLVSCLAIRFVLVKSPVLQQRKYCQQLVLVTRYITGTSRNHTLIGRFEVDRANSSRHWSVNRCSLSIGSHMSCEPIDCQLFSRRGDGSYRILQYFFCKYVGNLHMIKFPLWNSVSMEIQIPREQSRVQPLVCDITQIPILYWEHWWCNELVFRSKEILVIRSRTYGFSIR